MIPLKCKLLCPCLIIAAVVIGCVINFVVLKETSSLQLVTVVFRHGERTLLTSYTNDPHINQTYFPYGVGQLTTEGKRKMYDIGSQLRSIYGDFLGAVYSYDILKALSSDFPRTRMSLQLVLAGLFPPTEKYSIVPGLKWQPVDFNYITFEEDDMLAFWGKCEEYNQRTEEMFTSPNVIAINEKYKDVYAYLELHSGDRMRSLFDVCWFYPTFKAQERYGLKLPEWTKKIYPSPVKYFHHEQWKALVADERGRRYAAGRLLKTIGDNYLNRANGTSNERIYLYSAHDYTLVGLLASMNIDHDYQLPYAAYITIELHKINEEYRIKVLYQDYSLSTPSVRIIKGCDEYCPLEKFINLTSTYYPNPNVCII